MALDEPKTNDMVIEKAGIKFVVDKNLENFLPFVNIGFRRSWLGTGFYVEPGKDGPHADGCC